MKYRKWNVQPSLLLPNVLNWVINIILPNCAYDSTIHPSPLFLCLTCTILFPLGRLSTAYEYDDSGRVVAVIAPTGSRTAITSTMAQVPNTTRKLLTLAVAENGNRGDDGIVNTLSLTPDQGAYFSHGQLQLRIVFVYIFKIWYLIKDLVREFIFAVICLIFDTITKILSVRSFLQIFF